MSFFVVVVFYISHRYKEGSWQLCVVQNLLLLFTEDLSLKCLYTPLGIHVQVQSTSGAAVTTDGALSGVLAQLVWVRWRDSYFLSTFGPTDCIFKIKKRG